jgi:hypothetical protein
VCRAPWALKPCVTFGLHWILLPWFGFRWFLVANKIYWSFLEDNNILHRDASGPCRAIIDLSFLSEQPCVEHKPLVRSEHELSGWVQMGCCIWICCILLCLLLCVEIRLIVWVWAKNILYASMLLINFYSLEWLFSIFTNINFKDFLVSRRFYIFFLSLSDVFINWKLYLSDSTKWKVIFFSQV